MSLRSPTFSALSEDALLVTIGNSADADNLGRVRALAHLLSTHPLPGVREIVTSYTTLAVYFDPLVIIHEPRPGRSALAAVARWVRARAREVRIVDGRRTKPITIPVCYGGEHGQDIKHVARHAHISEEQVIGLHSIAEYEVAAIGFAPGFSYLLGLDPQLATPRRSAPRTRVPAGSVGIGGGQTGIYPFELPGGWNLIGQTPLKLFDPTREPPTLLSAGTRLRFQAIDTAEFARLSAENEGGRA